MPLNHVQYLPVRINFEANTPPSVQLAGQIHCIIARGQLKDGDLLPQIRRLADQLELNPNTVARAYGDLTASGVLIKRQGSGCYVKGPAPNRKPADRLKPLVDRIEELVTDARALGVSIQELIVALNRHEPVTGKPATGRPETVSKPDDLDAPARPQSTTLAPNLWQAAGELVD